MLALIVLHGRKRSETTVGEPVARRVVQCDFVVEKLGYWDNKNNHLYKLCCPVLACICRIRLENNFGKYYCRNRIPLLIYLDLYRP